MNTDPTYVAEMRLHAVRMVAMKMFREHTEGMPIRAVAEQLGTSVSQIQRMMAGEANLAATIRALFLLGVPVKPVEAA